MGLAAALLMGTNALLAAGGAVIAEAAGLAEARADLQAGRADDAVKLLHEALRADGKNAEANHLLCRVEYGLEQFDQAAEHCQKAVDASPQNARYHLWLGRALGERASRASFLSAFSLAKKTREQFEVAVKIDGRDADALADLGEFYMEAPGAVGGGMDKAEEVAGKLAAVDAARGHHLRGAMAEKQKDFAGAEKEFRAATGGAHSAVAWMELASFYRRRERWDEMLATVEKGAAVEAQDMHAAIALYDGAGVLMRADRNANLAIKLLSEYVSSPDKSEEAPVFEALTKLANLREKAGDMAGGARDRAAALAVAHEYKPAQEHKH